MASAELLKMTRGVDVKVMGVDDRVKGVEGKVQDVRDDVQDVRDDVQDVGNQVQVIDGRVQDVHDGVQDVDIRVQNVDNRVQNVDDKLDQANRSLSLQHLPIVPRTKMALQGTNSGIVFPDGYHPRTHPSTITTHAKLITTVQLSGSSKEVYLIDGNLPDPSYGYTENVRYSRPSPMVNS